MSSLVLANLWFFVNSTFLCSERLTMLTYALGNAMALLARAQALPESDSSLYWERQELLMSANREYQRARSDLFRLMVEQSSAVRTAKAKRIAQRERSMSYGGGSPGYDHAAGYRN